MHFMSYLTYQDQILDLRNGLTLFLPFHHIHNTTVNC